MAIGTRTKAKANVSSAYGKTLREHGLDSESLNFEFEYDELDKSNPEHVAAARAEFDDEDMVAAVNAKRKASARAKATEKALADAGIEKPATDSPEVIYRNLLRQFKLAKMEDAQAEQMARQISGFTS